MQLISNSNKVASASQLPLQKTVVLAVAVCANKQHDPWKVRIHTCRPVFAACMCVGEDSSNSLFEGGDAGILTVCLYSSYAKASHARMCTSL